MGKAVVDVRHPVHPRERGPLGERNRSHRHIFVFAVQRHQVRRIKAAVQRTYMDDPRKFRQREMHIINMEVNDVELIGALQHFFQHYKMMGELILAFIVIQTKSLRATGDQARSRLGVTAGEKCDVVPGVDERFR